MLLAAWPLTLKIFLIVELNKLNVVKQRKVWLVEASSGQFSA